MSSHTVRKRQSELVILKFIMESRKPGLSLTKPINPQARDQESTLMSTGASCEGSSGPAPIRGALINKPSYFHQKRNTEEEANYKGS